MPYDLYDLVFLNAGVIGQPGPCWTETRDDVWQVNWTAARRGVQRLVPGWLEAGHKGRIVFTASMAALIPIPYAADYCATKAALVALAECLYHELQIAGSAIGVSVAVPSFTQSNLASQLEGEFAGQFRKFVEKGSPVEEVAQRIVDGALAGEFLIVTHPGSVDIVPTRIAGLVSGAPPLRPAGRRMEALFRTKY